mmetsp:Transcript_81379/g.143641  ORF Transcript_81379/g.143641 Transcript_81379/m.143641 type:complete len:97 (+) Transcript_81379:994-1284(+)
MQRFTGMGGCKKPKEERVTVWGGSSEGHSEQSLQSSRILTAGGGSSIDGGSGGRRMGSQVTGSGDSEELEENKPDTWGKGPSTSLSMSMSRFMEPR